jgi:hypothetical protein
LSKFFSSYKGRQIPVRGERVQVYRNLKFRDRIVYSIRDTKTGLVLGHASNLLLSGCKFNVNQRGRERVLKERKKNVHAYVEGHFGIIHAGDDRIFSEGTKIQYNPYTNSYFEMVDCGEPIVEANIVWIDEGLVVASNIIRSWETRSFFFSIISTHRRRQRECNFLPSVSFYFSPTHRRRSFTSSDRKALNSWMKSPMRKR